MCKPTERSVKLNRRTAVVATGAGLLATTLAQNAQAATEPGADQWWRWRGPLGNNHAAPNAAAPRGINSRNLLWSVETPGRGHGTPIVVGDSLYMATADKQSGTQAVVRVNRDGSLNGSQVIHRGALPAENHRKNTEASSTLAFDGEHLYAAFYNDDAIRLTKLTPAGSIRWQVAVGRYQPDQYKYGYAASPLLYRDTVIVVGDYDGPSFLTAMDRATGQKKWSVARPNATSFSSPIIANINGMDQLLLSGGHMVAAYNPVNGNLLWKVDGATTMATCGTMVWDGNHVIASGGYPKSETVCIVADGSGRVAWSNTVKCYEQSLVAKDGFVYGVADRGIAYCWDVKTGNVMWQQRLRGPYSSSPLLVGDTILVFNELGQGNLFQATPERYVDLGQGQVADEVFASPVIVDDTLYLRVANNQGNRRQESVLAIR